jgi:Flp pilus assembly protein TadB
VTVQRSKGVNLDDLLKDLARVIESDQNGSMKLEELFEAAQSVKAEEAVRLGVGISKVRHP